MVCFALLRRFIFMLFEPLMQLLFRKRFFRIHYHICSSLVPVRFSVFDFCFKGCVLPAFQTTILAGHLYEHAFFQELKPESGHLGLWSAKCLSASLFCVGTHVSSVNTALALMGFWKSLIHWTLISESWSRNWSIHNQLKQTNSDRFHSTLHGRWLVDHNEKRRGQQI